MLTKLLTALAVLGLSTTAAVATDSTGTVSNDVTTSEVSGSPSPSETLDPTGTPDPTFSPDPTPDVSEENVPQGKAYG